MKCWGGNAFGPLGDGTTTQRLTPVDVLGLSSRVAAIAVSQEHTCALTTSGGVKCWGYNGFGRLGDGTTMDRLTPVDVLGLSSGVAAIAASPGHTCAVTTGGGAKCWGGNFLGQLGDGTTSDRPTPVDVSGLASGVAAIAAGFNHACAVTTGGAVKCWGYNGYGHLGDGTTMDRLTPVDVQGLATGVAAISAGGFHTCALTTGGGVKCWGQNLLGQLGNGTISLQNLTPIDVSGLSSGVAAIHSGDHHTCALTTGGGVKCWGYNARGQLGDGTNTNRLTPVDVSGLASGVAAIAAGGDYTCALTSGGGVNCWGDNAFGQLGDGTAPQRLTPDDVVGLASGAAAVEAGFLHTCALTTGGGMKCWGANYFGQLGDGTYTQRVTPVDVSGLASGVAVSAAGGNRACAVTTGGGMKCWGYNFYGQLGDGTTTTSWTPVDVSGLATGVAAVAAGQIHTCALTTTGGVKCWGDNSSGQLGDGTTIQRLSPVDVLGLGSGMAAVAAGGLHTCALTTGGGVKCWGYNGAGQLGDGTTMDRLNPADVPGLATGVAALSAGTFHTCALTTGGGVKCWGDNGSGQLGDGTTAPRGAPIDVPGLATGVAAISVGTFHTCALTTGGGMKCWGSNERGKLGDGSTTRRLTPVDVLGLASGVARIAAGTNHTCAITIGGRLKCWGGNEYGQLGDGKGLRSLPGNVMTFAGIVASVTSTQSHSLALDATGKVYAWGSDSHGQSGQGRAINRPTPARVSGIGPMTQISFSQHALAIDSSGQVWGWGDNACGQLGPRESPVTTKPASVTGATSMARVASGACFSIARGSNGSVTGWGLVPGYGTQTGVRPLAGLAGTREIAAGTNHGLALTDTGTVLAFGENAASQLGLGASGPAQSATLVPGLTGVLEIAAGRESSAALLTNGQIWFWGRLPDENVVFAPRPTPAPPGPAISISFAGSELRAALVGGGVARYVSEGVWQVIAGFSGIGKIEGGVDFDLGIGPGGQVYARGANTAGQLGQGNTNPTGSVVAVPGMTAVSQIAAGTVNPSVLALKSDGSVWFWGADTLGESGDGGAIGSSVPRAVAVPIAIRQIAAGDRFSLALDVNGDVWGWGDNGGMPLDGTLVNRSIPARIPGASNVQSIAAGGPGLALYHATDNTVFTSGTLVPGTVADAVKVVPSLNSIVTIAAGSSAYALRSDNTLFAFGSNVAGELGNGSTAPSTVPVVVQGINGTIAQVSGGLNRAAAVTSDGNVWSWGAGPLGNGTSSASSTAVQATGIADAAEISVGRFATLVRLAGSGMRAWGDAGLSDGASQNMLLPYPVAPPEPVRSARLGSGNPLGYLIGNTGLLWGFGQGGTASNLSAAVGDGTYVPRARPVVVNAAGGSGSLEANNWFLDLEPATAETIPVASKPKVLGESELSGYGGLDGITLSAALKARAADIGKNVGTYVFAFVPADFLQAATVAPSLTQARVKALQQKNGPLLFLQLTLDGWADATGQLIAYTSGVLSGAKQPVKILNGTPLTAIPGVRFCIGYGEDAGSMLTSGTLIEVLKVKEALGSEGGASCILNGVYVTGPPTSIETTPVTFRALVVGATPSGSVQFKDTLQNVTQDLQGPKTLALGSEAVATASLDTNALTQGTHSIGALYSGDSQNAQRPADVALLHEVKSALTGATLLLTGPIGSKQGDTVTFAARVTGNKPSGSVQFRVDGVAFGGAVPMSPDSLEAKLTTAALPLGMRQVSALYLGDVNNSQAPSNVISHEVSLTTPIVTLSAGSGPVQAGMQVQLTAAVSGASPTGNVKFLDGSSELGSANLSNGSATFVVSGFPSGLHPLLANYGGDGANKPASSPIVYLQVQQAPTLVTVTVSKSGEGAGTVSSNPAGIACGATCSAQFLTGSSVTLTATPSAGSSFVGWTGACAGSGACTLSIDAAKSVSARFEKAGTGITLAPAALAFGGQSMNTTAPTQTVTLTNNSGAAIEVTAVDAPPGFGKGYGCAIVSPGASCPVYVNFTPTVQGDYAANVAVLYTQGGETRASLLPVTGTGERSLVTHYYQSILRRPPDPGGKTHWQNEAARVEGLGASVIETWYAMAQTFYTSGEYAAFNRSNSGFVTDLYVTFFNRAPDSGGLNFWTGQIDQGMSREVALASFMFSKEFADFAVALFGNTAARAEVTTVMDFYRGLLGRIPDTGGFNLWVGRFRTAQCQGAAAVVAQVEAISSAFTLSPEYAARGRSNPQYVGDLYNAFLRRGGDLGGVLVWINKIGTGALSREQLRVEFKNSPEFQGRLNAIVAQGCL